MLILIGVVPTAYALNRSMPPSQVAQFAMTSHAAAQVVENKPAGYKALGDPRAAATAYVAQRKINEGTYPSLAALMRSIASAIQQYGAISKVPAAAVGNTRSDMYLASEAIRLLMKDKQSELSADDIKILNAYKEALDGATKFIPTWVKVAVAIALGLGTTIGWRRIVITVGEKIRKTHMTYAQGARVPNWRQCRRLLRPTISACRSPPPMCSPRGSGTMAASGSGLQWATVRNLVMAWGSHCRPQWFCRGRCISCSGIYSDPNTASARSSPSCLSAVRFASRFGSSYIRNAPVSNDPPRGSELGAEWP